ncbi:hypothetical protein [Streptomyces sp. NPDC005780]|uniref:hypothetical protein n=1 Tax=Streptomyces sp. NPDC005780 TaxID=3364730 RepID=UPI00367A87F2
MNDRLYAAFLLSLIGLRPAEIRGMSWADVDLGGATSTVNRNRTLMGNKYVKPDVEDLRPAAATWGELASVPPPLSE